MTKKAGEKTMTRKSKAPRSEVRAGGNNGQTEGTRCKGEIDTGEAEVKLEAERQRQTETPVKHKE